MVDSTASSHINALKILGSDLWMTAVVQSFAWSCYILKGVHPFATCIWKSKTNYTGIMAINMCIGTTWLETIRSHPEPIFIRNCVRGSGWKVSGQDIEFTFLVDTKVAEELTIIPEERSIVPEELSIIALV
jgi:hypothetical protein